MGNAVNLTELLEAEKARCRRIMELNYVRRAATITALELRLVDGPEWIINSVKAAVAWCEEKIHQLQENGNGSNV